MILVLPWKERHDDAFDHTQAAGALYEASAVAQDFGVHVFRSVMASALRILEG